MEEDQSLLNNELHIDTTAQSYLFETAKWGNFLAIVGFILSGLLAVIALFAGTIFSYFSAMNSSGGSFIGAGFITVLYLLIAAFNFYVALLVYRFSKKMKIALGSNDQVSLNESFLNLKRLYKFLGIITIIYLASIVLVMVIGIGSAAFRR
jgi:hypothetical protein